MKLYMESGLSGISGEIKDSGIKQRQYGINPMLPLCFAMIDRFFQTD